MEETEDERATFWEVLTSLNLSFNIHPFNWLLSAHMDNNSSYFILGPVGVSLTYYY